MNESKGRLHEIVERLIRRTANGELVWSKDKDIGELYSADLTKENGRSLKVFIARREFRSGQILGQILNPKDQFIFTARYYDGEQPVGDAILVFDTGPVSDDEYGLLHKLYYYAKNSATASPEALDKLLEVLKT
jgi:hypothetical protein